MKKKSISLPLLVTLTLFSIAKIDAAPAPTAFTYQGKLTDGSQPATGVYEMQFTLHDAATGGAVIGNPSSFPAVSVNGGTFNVTLDYGAQTFGTGARWLEISVRAAGVQEPLVSLAPRQLLTATPLADHAHRANSAATADSAGSVSWANVSGKPVTLADGVDNDTLYAAGSGLSLTSGNEFSVLFSGSGLAGTAARSDHSHFGAAWTGASATTAGLSLTNTALASRGLYAKHGAGSGFTSVLAFSAGAWGDTDNDYGLLGTSDGGSGVCGIATAVTGATYGLQGQSRSTGGRGVGGFATTATGVNYGVYGTTNSPAGYGLFGLATTYATTGTGAGVYGRLGQAPSAGAASPYQSAGVMGLSRKSAGIVGISDDQDGVYGRGSNGVTGEGESCGVVASAPDGVGLLAKSESGFPLILLGSPQTDMLMAAFSVDPVTYSWKHRFSVKESGDIYASGSLHPNGADFAEMLPAKEGLEPGDVLVIGEDGHLERSTQPHQESLAGIYATKPGLIGGAEDGADLTGKIPMAVVGVVPVKVCGENGAIKPGDRLTSSSIPGRAMKSRRGAEVGTVIGKALEGFKGDTGVIRMLVVLQ